MSLGTLYTSERARGILPPALVKHLGLDIKVEAPEGETFEKNFPLKKIPAFLGKDGFQLTESVAVNLYLVSLAGKTELLGKTKEDYASIVRWMSFTNSEVFPALFEWFGPLTGRAPYNKKSVDAAQKTLNEKLAVLGQLLAKQSYLVGERVTVADLYLASMLSRGFQYVFGNEWRKAHPAIARHFATVTKQTILAESFKDFELIAEPVKYQPPKKEEKKPAEKPAAPPAPPAEEAPKKPAHPLAALGPAQKLNLENWKRVYSNEETREKAIPWFWEHYDPSEYSLWKVDYKYNDELTLTFMSNNLIGGTIARLQASLKYVFGSFVVFGENNNNGITGFIMVRGDDYLPAVDVGPDYESYDFKKMDSSKPEDKEFIENMLAWDKPVVDADGKEREIADGKVLK